MSELPKLSFKQFVDKGALEPDFLRAFVRDPERIATRYDIEAGLLDQIRSEQALLEAIALHSPSKLSVLAKAMYNPSPYAFTDHRDGDVYRDRFNDGASDGGFVDRFNDRHG